MDSKQNESIFHEFWHWKNRFYVRDKMNICDTFGQGFCPHSCHWDNSGEKGFHTYASGHDLSLPPLSCYGGSQSSSLLSLSSWSSSSSSSSPSGCLFGWKHCKVFKLCTWAWCEKIILNDCFKAELSLMKYWVSLKQQQQKQRHTHLN